MLHEAGLSSKYDDSGDGVGWVFSVDYDPRHFFESDPRSDGFVAFFHQFGIANASVFIGPCRGGRSADLRSIIFEQCKCELQPRSRHQSNHVCFDGPL